MGLPAQEIVSQRWSSVNKKMMFGRFAVVVFLVRSSPWQPVIGIAVDAALAAMSFTNSRRLRFSVFGWSISSLLRNMLVTTVDSIQLFGWFFEIFLFEAVRFFVPGLWGCGVVLRGVVLFGKGPGDGFEFFSCGDDIRVGTIDEIICLAGVGEKVE